MEDAFLDLDSFLEHDLDIVAVLGLLGGFLEGGLYSQKIVISHQNEDEELLWVQSA